MTRAIVLLAALLAGGCTQYATFEQQAPFRTGQILVSEQGSPNSLFLSLLLEENRPYVHSALIVVEDGRPQVYEANGHLELAFGRGPLTERVTGAVARLDLDTFLFRNRYVALYDPPAGIDTAAMARYARESLERAVPFDAYFDGTDPSRVYCSEFIALALAAGGAPPPRTIAMNPNASVRLLLDWLGIRTPNILPPAELVAGATRVGVFSRQNTPAQYAAWFAAKAELHRRFTPEQKLGNVLAFSRLRGFRFRAAVAEFIAATAEAAKDWDGLPETEIGARVRAMADATLGAFAIGDMPNLAAPN